MESLLWLLRYARDESGQWVPTWCGLSDVAGGAPVYAIYAAQVVALGWVVWRGIAHVRRGRAEYWHHVWWAAFGYSLMALLVGSNAYRLWSRESLVIAAGTAVGAVAWGFYGFRKVFPLWAKTESPRSGSTAS